MSNPTFINGEFEKRGQRWLASLSECKKKGSYRSCEKCTEALKDFISLVDSSCSWCLTVYHWLLSHPVLEQVPTPCRRRHQQLLYTAINDLTSRKIKESAASMWFEAWLAIVNEFKFKDPIAARFGANGLKKITHDHNTVWREKVVESYRNSNPHLFGLLPAVS